MSEKNTNGLSVSFRVDSGYLDHNNRVITAHNVDVSRTAVIITYTKIDLRDFYQQVFGEAVAEYNAKQKRADREIPDYYEHVKKSGKGKLFYEVIVQFGDLHDCGSWHLKIGKRRKLCLMSICVNLKREIRT